MNNNTDQHAALVALPASFTPIDNPPAWTPAADLPLYLAEEQDEGVPALPANASMEDGYAHVLLRLHLAVTELRVALAVRAAFNQNRHDPDHVRALLARPWRELMEHLRAVDLARAYLDTENPESVAEVRAHINGELNEAAILLAEHDRLVGHHGREPGTVSLWQLLELAYRQAGLSCALVEFYWFSNQFERPFEAVVAPMRIEGFCFLNTAPKPGLHVCTVWRRRTPDEGSGDTPPVA